MKWLRFSVFILATAVIGASSLMDVISLTQQHIRPNLLLIMLVYFAINCDSYDAIICSFAIGFAADITGTLIGPYFLSFGLVGTALTHVRKLILLRTTAQQAFAIVITGLCVHIIAMILMKLKATDTAAAGFLNVLASSLYSAILWFLLHIPVKTFGKWMGVGTHRFSDRMIGRV